MRRRLRGRFGRSWGCELSVEMGGSGRPIRLRSGAIPGSENPDPGHPNLWVLVVAGAGEEVEVEHEPAEEEEREADQRELELGDGANLASEHSAGA